MWQRLKIKNKMTANNWRPISHIPMFEVQKTYGNAIYESTYASDYQKRRSLENSDESAEDNLLLNQDVSQSMHQISLMKANHAMKNNLAQSVDPLAQPLYRTNKYGLLPIHRSRKIDGINYFRSEMDPSVMRDAKKELETRSLYNFDYTMNQKGKIPGYIKKDGYFHTNSEKNVRYLKSYNGSLIPYIPSFPLNKRPLPPIRTDVAFSKRFDNAEDGKMRHYEKLSNSSQELGKYFNNIQYHQRDISPPA